MWYQGKDGIMGNKRHVYVWKGDMSLNKKLNKIAKMFYILDAKYLDYAKIYIYLDILDINDGYVCFV